MRDPVIIIGVTGVLVCVLGAVTFAAVHVRHSFRVIRRARAISAVEAVEPYDPDLWAASLADLSWG